jgi:hypothetical protein
MGRKLCDLVMPPHGGMHVLVGKDDRREFLASSSTLGPSTAIAVSLVCLRASQMVKPNDTPFYQFNVSIQISATRCDNL